MIIHKSKIKCIILITLIILISSNAAAAFDWLQFRGETHNFGITFEKVPTNPVVLWAADIQRVDATPIICSDTVYVIGGNGTLYAFDARTGDKIWSSSLNGWIFQSSTPVCVDYQTVTGNEYRVFAATDSGVLASCDGKSGNILWKHHVTDKRFESPLIYADGRIYIGEGSAYGTAEKRYFCFFENGTECWNYTTKTKGYMWCGACILGDYLIAGQNDGVLLSLNRMNGTLADVLRLNDSNRLGFSRPKPGRIRASVTCKCDWIYTTSELSAEEGYAWKIGFDVRTGKFEDRGWSTPIGFSTSTPVILNDRVYVGAGEHGHPGALICLNNTTGEVIWSYSVEAGVKSSPTVSIANDKPRILFTTARIDGFIYCIEDAGRSGELLWKFDPPDNGYILGGVALYDGRLYIGTEGDQHYGKLYCLGDDEWHQFHHDSKHTGFSNSKAPKTNKTLWISDYIGAQAGSSVAVAEGRVFVNCVDKLVCLNQSSGDIIWSYPFKSAGDYAFGFTPVYHSGKVFFTSDKTYCLDAADGKEIWTFSPPTCKFAIDGSPAIADGKVVVSDWDGHHYYCLEEETGKELWSFEVKGNAQSTPAIDRDKVVFGSWEWGSGGKIYCVYLNNGTEIWNLSTENSPCGSAMIHNEVVYMATYNFYGDGDLFALSLSNGSALWRAVVSPTDSTPAFADDRVYLCGGCEGFSRLFTYCFDALTGELLWNTSQDDKIGDWRCSPAYADGLIFVGRPNFNEYKGIFALNATNGEIVWAYPEGGSSPAVADGVVFTVGNGRVYAFGEPKCGAYPVALRKR